MGTLGMAVMLTMFRPAVAGAGTLSDAPFHVVLPGADWKLDDSKTRPMGKAVSLVATINNQREHIRSFVLRETLQPPADKALDELSAGIRDSFTKRNVKKISESDAAFLGFPAKTFTYEVIREGQTNFNATTVFVAGESGWTIACVGRAGQSNEVQEALSFYQR